MWVIARVQLLQPASISTQPVQEHSVGILIILFVTSSWAHYFCHAFEVVFLDYPSEELPLIVKRKRL